MLHGIKYAGAEQSASAFYKGDFMNIKSIFEKVNLLYPLEQRKFFNYLSDTINELITKYGEKFVIDGEALVFPDMATIESEINILPMYEKAIVNNVLFLCGAGETYISEFMRLAEEAYLYYYRQNAKNRRLKRKVF